MGVRLTKTIKPLGCTEPLMRLQIMQRGSCRLLARLMKYHGDKANRRKSIRKLERELGVDHE